MKVKSQFASIVFTGMFGPFGLFYSSSLAAINMIVIWIISAFVIISKTSQYSFYSLPELFQLLGGYVIWLFLIYIASIIIGMLTVMKYNDNFAIELEKLIDKKISKRDQVWTAVEIDPAKAEKLGVVGLTRSADSYVFLGAQRKAWNLLKYEVKAELENQGFSGDYDIADSMRMRRENKAIQMEFTFEEKTIKINLENIALPIAIEKLFTHEDSEAVDVNAEKVFCTKCGKENNSDAKFCTSCGSGINTSA
ncbi:MAG: zinc-ribbon domain-containing protein [Sulfurimonas sp.]|jgi:hypothetical protein